jgi:hypothetical protein
MELFIHVTCKAERIDFSSQTPKKQRIEQFTITPPHCLNAVNVYELESEGLNEDDVVVTRFAMMEGTTCLHVLQQFLYLHVVSLSHHIVLNTVCSFV